MAIRNKSCKKTDRCSTGLKLNQIYPGNCLDLLPTLPGESVHLVFSDPPYSTALEDIYRWGKDLDFRELAKEFDRVLKPTGQVAVFGDFRTAVEIANSFRDYFQFRFFWIWKKTLGQPINKFMPISETELILVFKKLNVRTSELTFNFQDISTTGKPYRKFHRGGNSTRKKYNGYITENKGMRYPKQILEFPSKCNIPSNERTSHPCQKPVNLCRYIIRALSNPGDIILDPFSGSGSISLGAYKEKRNFIGFEINPDYHREAETRLKNAMAQVELF